MEVLLTLLFLLRSVQQVEQVNVIMSLADPVEEEVYSPSDDENELGYEPDFHRARLKYDYNNNIVTFNLRRNSNDN